MCSCHDSWSLRGVPAWSLAAWFLCWPALKPKPSMARYHKNNARLGGAKSRALLFRFERFPKPVDTLLLGISPAQIAYPFIYSESISLWIDTSLPWPLERKNDGTRQKLDSYWWADLLFNQQNFSIHYVGRKILICYIVTLLPRLSLCNESKKKLSWLRCRRIDHAYCCEEALLPAG